MKMYRYWAAHSIEKTGRHEALTCLSARCELTRARMDRLPRSMATWGPCLFISWDLIQCAQIQCAQMGLRRKTGHDHELYLMRWTSQLVQTSHAMRCTSHELSWDVWAPILNFMRSLSGAATPSERTVENQTRVWPQDSEISWDEHLIHSLFNHLNLMRCFKIFWDETTHEMNRQGLYAYRKTHTRPRPHLGFVKFPTVIAPPPDAR